MIINISASIPYFDVHKIFVLEDQDFRVEIIKKLITNEYQDTITFYANSTETAKDILIRHHPFDLIMLDYDLEELPSETNNGELVAKFIRENNIRYNNCIIHCLNPNNANKLFTTLNGNCTIKPLIN